MCVCVYMCVHVRVCEYKREERWDSRYFNSQNLEVQLV